MKKIYLLISLLLLNLCLSAQNNYEYYIVAKPQYSLVPTSIVKNPDSTITVGFANQNIENFFAGKTVYAYEKAYKGATHPYLLRVYRITLDSNGLEDDILALNEMEYVRLRENNSFPLYTPNDYNLVDGSVNTSLELIGAKRAWNVTHGSSSVYVGIYENGYYDVAHEDLMNKIYVPNNPPYDSDDFHATMVSGCVAADTNNGLGIAGIGFDTSMIGADGPTESVWDFHVNNPQIKVINISQGWSCEPYPDKAAMFENLWNVGVVTIAGAGNAAWSANQCPPMGNGYLYPASYEHVISVTSVGHKYHRGSEENLSNWKDVHLYSPNIAISGHAHNDKVDICAPGYEVVSTNLNNTYAEGNGTSFASPIVAGVCALMLAVNPDITPTQIKAILESTAVNIYTLPENAGLEGTLGAGRLNAFGAVLASQCLDENNPEVDLAIWDSDEDLGEEPNLETDEMWRSPEIWVRNQADRRDTHQNPIYDSNNPNYVYVRVTNIGCASSSGNDQLTVYWAKANTSLGWPDNWDGSLYMEDPDTGLDVQMGDEIGTLTVPALNPGEEIILELEWNNVPDPSDYTNINPNPWHFCLLARIESTEDPLTDPNEPNINEQVGKNNNVAWKNTTIVDIDPNSLIGGVIGVGNPSETINTFDLEFTTDDNEPGIPIYEEAEVAIEMDSTLFAAWVKGGKMAHNLRKTRNDRIKIVTGDHARLKGIQFKPKEIGTLNLTFNFLTKEATDKTQYVYHAIQRYSSNDKIVGGETYIVNNQKEREMFTALAGNDQSIEDDESVTIQAGQINEPAIYNWYDPDGILIYTGPTLTISPEMTQKYKLEIIANSDGYKDYDEVEITVKPYSLDNMTPNPASGQVSIHYDAHEAGSAYLMITNAATAISNNYILNVQQNEYIVDVSAYAPGIYVVSLVCNGEVVASGNLAVN